MPVHRDARMGKAAKAAGEWALVIGGGLLALGLFVGLPVFFMVTHRYASADPWLAPTAFGGIVLGFAVRWWLRRPLSAPGPVTARHWQVGRRQAQVRALEDRAGKLCLVTALASYYVPALFTVVVNQGWGGVDAYLHGHLLDGFTFVAFLTAAWALVLQDYEAAVRKLIRSTAIIAIVGVYLADGRVLEIVIAGTVAEAFGRYFWSQVGDVGRELQVSDGEPKDAIRLQAIVVPKPGDRLSRGEVLENGQCLVAADKQHVVIMLNGELSIWKSGQDLAQWSSGTWDSGAKYAELDVDGRLVLREDPGGAAIWATGMPGGQADYLTIQSNGKLEARRADGTPTWAIGIRPGPYNLTDIFFQ